MNAGDMMNIEGKTILISGGSGSWGQELTRQLLEQNPAQVRIFSRGEISQVAMERSFDDKRLKFVIGDVRDERATDAVMEGVDYVYHLAALKHVPICENYPEEAIKTNVIGTMNLIISAVRNKVKKFVDVSTDKAVAPVNLYGYTKGLGERLSIQANCHSLNTDFICIRGGNVLGTNGSVVPYIINQIKLGREIYITDPQMTRFFLTIQQAIKLLFEATDLGVGGETFVMNMPSFYLMELIEVLTEYYGHADIKEIGRREGEKVHEVLIAEGEVDRTRYVDENYFVIYPQVVTGRSYPLRDKADIPAYGFSSADNIKDKEYLKGLLKLGGWLT